VPLHVTGGTVTTTGESVLPQASTTTGAVGATASAGQFTVDDPSAGNVKSGAAIV
jgi:hypothetical protein